MGFIDRIQEDTLQIAGDIGAERGGQTSRKKGDDADQKKAAFIISGVPIGGRRGDGGAHDHPRISRVGGRGLLGLVTPIEAEFRIV